MFLNNFETTIYVKQNNNNRRHKPTKSVKIIHLKNILKTFKNMNTCIYITNTTNI
jgi:hypothetical protein